MIKLTELFNKVYAWKREKSNSDIVKNYSFYTESGDLYHVTISEYYFSEIINSSLSGNELEKIIIDCGKSKDDVCYEVVFLKEVGLRRTYDITPTKNYISVFSTIIDILANETDSSDSLFFSAKETSRISLYDKMIPKLKRPADKVFKLHDKNAVEYFLIPVNV